MPQYQITDEQTGRTLLVEGDQAPDDDDIESLFSQLSAEEPSPPSVVEPSQPDGAGAPTPVQVIEKTEEPSFISKILAASIGGPSKAILAPGLGAPTIEQARLGLIGAAPAVSRDVNQAIAMVTDPKLGAGKLAPFLEKNAPGFMKRMGSVSEQFQGAADIAGEYAQDVETVGQATQGPDVVRRIATSAGSLLPTVAAAPLGIGAMAAASGFQQMGSTYGESLQARLPTATTPQEIEQAKKDAAIDGLASGFITALVTRGFGPTGVDILSKLTGKSAANAVQKAMANKGTRAAAAQFFKQVGMEAGEEGLDQSFQAILQKLRYNPDLTFADAARQVIEAAASGAVLSSFVNLPITAANLTQTEGVSDASQDRTTEEVYGDVRPQPEQVQEAVPAQEGGPGVQPQVQEQVDPTFFNAESLATPQSERIGVTSGTFPGLSRAFKNLGDYLKRKATTKAGLPDPAFAAKEAMSGEINRAEKDIKFALRDFKDTLGKEFGIGKVAAEAGGFRRIPQEAVKAMDAYLKGELPDPSIIPVEIRGKLDNMRAIVTGRSKKIIEMLSESGADSALIDIISNNLDTYLARSYRFFDSKLNAYEWVDSIDPAVKQRALQLISDRATQQNNPLAPDEAESVLLNWMSDLRDQKGIGTSRLGAKDLSLFMKRKQIAPEIRAILGEYNDPMINFARSVSRMSDWIAKQEFLTSVRDAGIGQWLFAETDAPPGFNTRIAAEGSDTMSPLNGLRTSPEIAAAFEEFSRKPSDPNIVWKTYLRLNAITKISSTVLSVLTQQRNLASQPWFFGMAGHWRLGELGTTLRAVAEDIGVKRGDSGSKWRDYIREAAKHGIVGDTARSQELKALLEDAAFADVTPEGLTDFSFARLAKKFGYRIPAEIYKLSDELGKIYGWENEKALVQKVHPDWTQEQIATEAAKRVRNLYPTYSKVPKWVQEMRKLPFGPFVSFPYEIIRTSINGIGLSLSEIRSENPVEKQIGVKRLASQMLTLGSSFALSALTAAIMGVDDEEEEDIRRFLPPWSKNSQLLYLSKVNDGKVRFLNLSYQDPYAYIKDPFIAAISASSNDESIATAAARAVAEMFSPFVSEQMLAGAMVDVARNTTETGRKIFNPQDDLTEKVMKSVDHVGMTLLPGTAQRMRRRILPSILNDQPSFGRKLNPKTEITAELTGLRLEEFDFRTALGYGARRFTANVSDAENIFRERLGKPAGVTPGGMVDAFSEAQEKRFGLWVEMRKDTLAAMRSGVPQDEVFRLLRDMGLSGPHAGSIMDGVYRPWMPSRETLSRVRQRSGQQTVEQMNQVFDAYSGRALETAR